MPEPAFQIEYNGKNVTADVSPFLLQLQVIDQIERAASTLELAFEDADQRWQGPWFPARGDRLGVRIGYPGNLAQLEDFEIDEAELDGLPDVMTIRAISAAITQALRTHHSQAWEGPGESTTGDPLDSDGGETTQGKPTPSVIAGCSLLTIVRIIAAKHQLRVETMGSADVPLRRVTQKHETDVGFLQRLADTYGYNFTIRAGTLVFVERSILERQMPILTIERSRDAGQTGLASTATDTVLKHFTFLLRTERVYKNCIVRYNTLADSLDVDASKALISITEEADPPVVVGDTLQIRRRAESAADARAKAAAALHAHNMHRQTGRWSIIGDARVVSGIVIAFSGFGKFDGNYLIESSTHTITRNEGYVTEFSGRLAA